MTDVFADAARAAEPPSALLANRTTTQIATDLFPSGRLWSGGAISYSFPTSSSQWPSYSSTDEPFVGFSALTAGQQSDFRAAIQTWDRLISPSLVETDDLTSTGMIRVAFSGYSELSDAAAYAYSPPIANGSVAPWHGDIWINNEHQSESFPAGDGGFEMLVHEIGHALGLDHPFERPGFPAEYDNIRFTVMAYNEPSDFVAVSIRETSTTIQAMMAPVYPSTPMVFDIAAIQSRYGADPTTASGDNRYTFSQTEPFFRALYDAGGVDTIDLSNLTRGSNVDLTPGAYSSIAYFSAADQISTLIARYPWAESYIREAFAAVPGKFDGLGVYTWSNNFGIAYSTVIENVTGSPGADTITGNDAGNGILGGGGADSIRGLNGDDWIDAGAGDDDANGNQGVDVVHGGDGADWVRGGQGADTVYGDEGADPHVNGNLGDDVVYGGGGDDTVYGGQGADKLQGDDGNDWLSGDLGDDTLVGGAGADRFLFRPGSGFDWVADFSSAAGDRVQLPTGVAYTLAEQQGQVVIDLGDGARLGLAGVSIAAMGDWLVYA